MTNEATREGMTGLMRELNWIAGNDEIVFNAECAQRAKVAIMELDAENARLIGIIAEQSKELDRRHLEIERLMDNLRNQDDAALAEIGKRREEIADLNRRAPLLDNKPLTLDELREMIGGCAWCKDTDGLNLGLLCLRHRWDDAKKEVHIWLLDEEGNTGVYDVEYMIKCGAKFYRRPPEKGD